MTPEEKADAEAARVMWETDQAGFARLQRVAARRLQGIGHPDDPDPAVVERMTAAILTDLDGER
ncbi:MAG: hypothetical protein QOJ13_2800 [Gaiellales bacterium]|jgi:hypothetical protein|nr:hypothetical protein [Gaiellales bacterium]